MESGDNFQSRFVRVTVATFIIGVGLFFLFLALMSNL